MYYSELYNLPKEDNEDHLKFVRWLNSLKNAYELNHIYMQSEK